MGGVGWAVGGEAWCERERLDRERRGEKAGARESGPDSVQSRRGRVFFFFFLFSFFLYFLIPFLFYTNIHLCFLGAKK
jgi:hypothetical protein